MKHSTQLALTLVFTLGIACSQPNESHAEDLSGIELIDGNKWLVNEAMKPHINQAERLLHDYMQDGGVDHRQLAISMKAHNMDLINSCTMTGQSHDQLHLWLHPHLNLLEQLALADTDGLANDIIEEIQSSFSIYHRYFQ